MEAIYHFPRKMVKTPTNRRVFVKNGKTLLCPQMEAFVGNGLKTAPFFVNRSFKNTFLVKQVFYYSLLGKNVLKHPFGENRVKFVRYQISSNGGGTDRQVCVAYL